MVVKTKCREVTAQFDWEFMMADLMIHHQKCLCSGVKGKLLSCTTGPSAKAADDLACITVAFRYSAGESKVAERTVWGMIRREARRAGSRLRRGWSDHRQQHMLDCIPLFQPGATSRLWNRNLCWSK